MTVTERQDANFAAVREYGFATCDLLRLVVTAFDEYVGQYTVDQFGGRIFVKRYDIVDGGQGDDLLDSGEGNDTVIGGLGNDAIDAGLFEVSPAGVAGEDDEALPREVAWMRRSGGGASAP